MSILLEYKEVSVSGEGYEGGLRDVSLTLSSGEVLMVVTESRNLSLPLFDLAQGLEEPDEGSVCFDGTDWRQMKPGEQAAKRAETGRIFGPHEGAWLSNLDVDENVTLRVRHRGGQPEEAVHDEARQLAQKLGLEELPGKRPPAYGRDVLQIGQSVRALLGGPRVLLAAYPLSFLHRDAQDRFIRLVCSRVEAGLAVIWLAQNASERNFFNKNARCFRYADQTLMTYGEEHE